MQKNIQLLLFLTFSFSSQWVDLESNTPVKPEITLVSSDIQTSTLSFDLEGFSLDNVFIDNSEYSVIKFPLSASIMDVGSPDLPKLSTSIIIPDDKNMIVEILSSNFVEYENMNVAPSKGNFSRLIMPEDVPYTFNKTYQTDAFYPNSIVQLNEPYIVRDFRGQVVEFHPIQYNPMTKVLRVYTNITVKVLGDNGDSINIFNRTKPLDKVDNEFNNIYQNHFINFDNDTRFDYLVDHGNMLVISYGDFMDEMQPLVDWKNMKGIPTEMVNVSSVGSNSSSITNYVADYYSQNGLTFLLLVGDIAQIPSPSVSGSASDISYGCITGNDFYQEVIVGRISASNPAQVITQVERSIEYERSPQTAGDWHDNALGVASNQGPGFGGMTDDDFNDYLWDTVLSDFTYDSYEGIYDGSGGSDSQGIAAINGGVSLINYTGHGSISSWGNGASLNTTQINQLTNDNRLPFVITVGCNVGEFNSTNECYAEAWQRATNGGEPTGGIAHFGSTISQSWEPPMHGQYGMNLILTESYDEHLTRSLGGITTNGCMYMNDAQGSSGINETKYWTFFGDPSVNIRTANPSTMNAMHDDVILVGQNEFVVDVGENGALAALSINGQLISSAYSQGGIAVLELGDAATTPGTLDLVVSGFNSYVYETEVTVIAPEGSYLSVDGVEVLGLGEGGHLLYGDNNYLTLSLSNVGSDPATNVTISMDTNSPYVDIIEDVVTYDDIAPNQSVEITGLNVAVDWNVPNGEVVNIEFQIISDDNTIEIEVPLAVQAPTISFNSMSGTLNPGESTTLDISLSNIGSAAINYPVVSLEGDAYVTVSSSGIGNAYYWDYLQQTNQEILSANVAVSPSAPIGHVAEFTVHVTNLDGGLNITFPVYLAIGQITENFESGFSPNLNWGFSGNQDWQITQSDQYEGYYSAQSGDITDSQTSQMSVTMDVVMAGDLEFYYRVASEYSPSGQNFYDGLEFYIDNQMVGQYQPGANGETPWVQASFAVTPGIHTFTWSYVKDGGPGSTDMEEDCAWVDYISFPPSMLEDGGGAMLGDVNEDGLISVLDIVQIINMVLDSEFNPLADVNEDGMVDVLDIILVVNVILEN